MKAAGPGKGAANGSRLRKRIVGTLLFVSLTPLCLAAAGGWFMFSRLLEEKSGELQRTVVSSHARKIDLFLAERMRALELVARSHQRDDLATAPALQGALEMLNETYGTSFIDLGVIGEGGQHLGYSGPYDLSEKNYRETDWFSYVMAQGSFVSDVFLGFRRVPHVIMAVKRMEGGRPWILRATINSDRLDALVRTGRIGESGDAFIVDMDGRYQTPPRLGRVLDQSPGGPPARHPGVRHIRLVLEGEPAVQVTTWLNGGRWMLVVRQDEREITAPAREALLPGLVLLAAAIILIVAATVLSTVHLTGQIARSNQRRDELSRDLLRSARLASLGELASGLAHEINNPLAIIGAEQTNIGDLLGDLRLPPEFADPLMESVDRCKRQVERCGRITAKILQFGRGSESSPEPTDIGSRLAEVVELLSRSARLRSIRLGLDLEEGLPDLHLDPTELQQVMVNLINNAMQAIGENGSVEVAALRNGNEALILVKDSGDGIAPENLEQIFQPFFSTKPEGQGTGLGLSVCYGLVQNWGGQIEAESEEGRGTVMTIRLPIPKEAPGDVRGPRGKNHG